MIEVRPSDKEFAALGQLMKGTWEQSADDPEPWNQFRELLSLRNMCVRWFLSEWTGAINLVLEEHANYADCFWAARKNDGSIRPLRSAAFRKVRDEWEATA